LLTSDENKDVVIQRGYTSHNLEFRSMSAAGRMGELHLTSAERQRHF